MNYLKGKKVYLAGHIHACSNDGITWREELTPKLVNNFGISVSDPCKMTINGFGEVKEDKKYMSSLLKEGKFREAKDKFWPIVRKDLRAVDQSDFLIVAYDPLIPTVGTWHEIVSANFQKKPVLMWYDKEKIENFNPWALVLIKEQWLFTEWDDIIDYLKVIDSGKIDSSYWTL